MSWLTRAQVAALAIVIAGMLLLIFGHLGSGWSALTYFAWGIVIGGAILLLNFVVSVARIIFQPQRRAIAIWIAAVSIMMLVCLILLWRVA